MGMVRVDISMELIRDALAIPEDVKIVQILRDEFVPYKFTFYFEGEGLPDVPEGGMPEKVNPSITWMGDWRPREFLRFDWNVSDGERS